MDTCRRIALPGRQTPAVLLSLLTILLKGLAYSPGVAAGISESACLKKGMGSTAADIAVRDTSANTAQDGVAMCQKECQRLSNCGHFTFKVDSKKCHMKGGSPQYTSSLYDWTATRGCDLGVVPDCLRPNLTSTNADEPGSGMIASAESASRGIVECQVKCKSFPGCTHFTYTNESRHCSLKKGIPSYQARYGHTSSTRDCDLGTENNLRVFLESAYRRWSGPSPPNLG